MRPRKFVETITFKLSRTQRTTVETLAERNEISIGEAARELLDAGIKARGLEC